MTQTVSKESEARSLYSQGLESFTRAHYKKAMRYFTRAAELAPNNPNCWSMLGHSLYSQGRNTEAIHAYVVESQLRPDSAAPYHDIALILASTGRFEEAVDFAKKSLNLVGNSIDVLFYVGRLAVKSKRNDFRDEITREILKRAPLTAYSNIFVSGFEELGS